MQTAHPLGLNDDSKSKGNMSSIDTMDIFDMKKKLLEVSWEAKES